MDEAESRATSRGPRSSDRKRIHAFIERHLLAWDLTMAVLALLYLGVGLVEEHPLGTLTQGARRKRRGFSPSHQAGLHWL